jgi:hypothetical protein
MEIARNAISIYGCINQGAPPGVLVSVSLVIA